MISLIFIDRPIFAWVIAIIIMLAGLGGVLSLPIEQYPDIAPPAVVISATYPGADAATAESSVSQVIEQQLLGIDGLLYFQSVSNASGQVNITVSFANGTNPDIAQVQVQNKVQQALSRLPSQVQQQGLIVTKSNADFLMVVALYDETDQKTSADVSDYLASTLEEPIGRLAGVGNVTVFGSQYAMRIWLDPFKLSSAQLMPSDVIAAVQAQNVQVPAGQIGAEPSPSTQMLNATVTARSRLTTPAEFQQILVKTNVDGSRVLLSDVAHVELGSESYTAISRFNGHPASGIAIQLAPGADSLKTGQLVKSLIEKQSGSFPYGFRYAYPLDSSPFIIQSVTEVVETLAIAILLVVIVMFLFLQSWQATLIPAIAVPVVLLGTFGILKVFGLSINTLTLFGMVLAIGLLVDDAIVVVENVERVMQENPDISPRDATVKAMGEIQTALIAIALVLSAVFLPMAFFGGSVGVIYQQFAITIISAMVLSVIVALVLSPALAAKLLKRKVPAAERRQGRVRHLFGAFGQGFNRWFDRSADGYKTVVAAVLSRSWPVLIIYVVVVAALMILFERLPTSFLPDEDQGAAQLQFTLPPGATQTRTLAAARTIEQYFLTTEKANVSEIYMVVGQNQAGVAQNAGRGFVALTPWSQRSGAANAAPAITLRATRALATLRDVQFVALNPPVVRGLGQSSGFTLQLLNTGNLSAESFKSEAGRIVAAAATDPTMTSVRLNALASTPTLAVSINQAEVGAFGLAQSDVNTELSAAWGGSYVNDFVDRGRVKRVYVQGDAAFRSTPDDLTDWQVRTSTGTMAPFSSFARTSWGQAPPTLSRFNALSSYEIDGQAAPGQSSGAAMIAISSLAAKESGVSVAWSGLSYQEQLSGSQTPMLYSLSILVVFLCLAALYESWSIPISVLLVIPLGVIGATLAVTLHGLTNDVYFQVGLLTTVGLSAKNAILIVEFAAQAEKEGKSPREAAIEAARVRLRPIIMTSLAFILGVLPLAIATGAGARSRIEIGTAVIGGTLTATALGIFFVPLAYYLVRRLATRKGKKADQGQPIAPAPPSEALG